MSPSDPRTTFSPAILLAACVISALASGYAIGTIMEHSKTLDAYSIAAHSITLTNRCLSDLKGAP